MDNFSTALAAANAKLKYYKVMPVEKVLAEDGKYLTSESVIGYGILNTSTGVMEHTTICLPAAMFQATHFDEMLASLLEGKASLTLVDGPSGEDILPGELN